MDVCYRLVRYPLGYKGRKKKGVPASNMHNTVAENVNAYRHKGNAAYNTQAENINSNVNAENFKESCSSRHEDFPRAPHLTDEQYDRIVKMLDK